MNRYIYARDNPLAFKDPDGNDPISLSSTQQAWVITGGLIVLAAAICIATIFMPGLLPVARAAVSAAVGATIYTSLKGEKATVAGVALTAFSSAASSGVGSVFSNVVKAAPAIKTFATAGNSLLKGEINIITQAGQHTLAGSEIDIEPLGVVTSMVLPAIPATVVAQTVATGVAQEVASYSLQVLNTVVNIKGDDIEAAVVYALSPHTVEDAEWSQINIFF
jgi:hypothetical protein